MKWIFVTTLRWMWRKTKALLHMVTWMLLLAALLLTFVPAGMSSKSGWRDFGGWLIACMSYNELHAWACWEGDDV